MPTTEAACGRRDPHAPHTETGTMLGAYYSHNCGGLVLDPRPDYVLRLTGEQIGSIDPPPEGDWFTDWDEYEDFVPRRMFDTAVTAALDALAAEVAGLDQVVYAHPMDDAVHRAAVLAAIEKARP